MPSMPSILSGSILRTGGSGEFIKLSDAMPQLPPTTSTTGFTLITNSLLQTSYASSLGNIEFNQASLYSNLTDGTIRILATGTNSVSTSTASGTLVVTGGVGIGRNLFVKEDINVNGLTIGRGYEGQNNIVFRGTATIPLSEGNDGQENIVIGYDALQGISSAYANIAIGRKALSSGTFISNSIAIGDYALSKLGIINRIAAASITGITQANPVVVTAPGHNLLNGTNISIDGVNGMTVLTTETFYISVLSSSTFRLYKNNILNIPVNGIGYSGYISSGTVYRTLIKDNNIGIGNRAGANLIEGEQNFFFGDQIARNLTTGSYNFFAGHGALNIYKGNNIISINGSLIVDGVDNQINFGSVFYYDGVGFANLNANTEIGLGDPSTSPTTGALTVIGGAGIGGNLNVAQELKVVGSGAVTLSPSNYNVYIQPTGAGSITIQPAAEGSIDNMSIGLNNPAGAKFDVVEIASATASTSTTTGALIVAGGVGIRGNIYSNTGVADENYLLYTPQIYITTSTPSSPRLGDTWIDPATFAYLQYIKDGTSTFWIQVGAI